MAALTIYIKSNGVGYDRDPPVVKPGDTVDFVIDGRTDTVTVTFDSGSPFPDNPSMTLNGGSPATASYSDAISSTASGQYRFTATPESRELPGTVHGDLDVSSDPPPKD